MIEPPLSVLVPVRNEAARIGETAPRLLAGLPRDADALFVLNGCTDDSEAVLRRAVGDRARIVTSAPGKAAAIREGERHLSAFPRFFVDSDVLVSGSTILRLSEELATRDLMLIAPAIRMDLRGASRAMRRLHGLWAALPHGRAAFHHVLGVSAAGRRRWGVFPDYMADDTFIEAMMPPERCGISSTESIVVRPPGTWGAFVRVRARWSQGQRQLAAAGIAVRRRKGQKRALLRLAATRLPTVIAYVATRLCASIRADPSDQWYTDRTSR